MRKFAVKSLEHAHKNAIITLDFFLYKKWKKQKIERIFHSEKNALHILYNITDEQ